MSKNQLNLKHGVLTKGGGVHKVVLCYDSGLCYQYSSPENITAIFQPGKGWVVREAPYYSRGGWGNKSSGDGDGYCLILNTQDLIRAIGGTCYSVKQTEFLTPIEISKINKGITKNNKLIDNLNKIAVKLGRDKNRNKQKLESLDTELQFKGTSPKGTDAVKTGLKYKDAVQVFIERKGKSLSIDSYKIAKDLVTQVIDKERTIVAFRDAQGQVFMNSQVLSVSSFEREFLGNQSMIQSEIRKTAKYNIPFNVLNSAKLNLSETRVLEQGPQSTHTIKGINKWGYTDSTKDIERHFTGALLLENSGRKFLMDIDRIEIEHGLFNAFFVEVDSKVTSIAEAYESMKPQEVKDAEKSGIEVKRQGEWFFIATGKTLKVSEDSYNTRADKDLTQQVHRFDVSHGKGRPNQLYRPVGFGELDQLVCGTVSHTGREHKDLDLGELEVENSETKEKSVEFVLWKLVGNTTVSNFTITGDVD